MRFDNGNGDAFQMRGRVWRSAVGLCVVAETEVDTPLAERAASEARREGRGQPQSAKPSITDKLTGAGNHERLDEAFAAELTRVQRTGVPLSVMMAAPDGYADLARMQGQEVADKVLAHSGFLMRLLTRPADIVTRFTTAQFVVLLPHTNLAQAMSAAERLRIVFAKDPVEAIGAPVTCSFGVAEYQSGEDLMTFVDRAGAALLHAGPDVVSAAS